MFWIWCENFHFRNNGHVIFWIWCENFHFKNNGHKFFEFDVKIFTLKITVEINLKNNDQKIFELTVKICYKIFIEIKFL